MQVWFLVTTQWMTRLTHIPILYWKHHSTVDCTVNCTLYCIDTIQKWLAVLNYSQSNVPLSFTCTFCYTSPCTEQYTVYCTIHYTIIFTVHFTICYSLHKWLSGWLIWPCSWGTLFLPKNNLAEYCTVQYIIHSTVRFTGDHTLQCTVFCSVHCKVN